MADSAQKAAHLRAWGELVGGFVAQLHAAVEEQRGAVERGLLAPDELARLEKEARAWRRHQDVVERP